MYITRHRAITDPHLREQLWRLYLRGYSQPDRLPTSEAVDREEFDRHVRSDSNRVWVNWDAGVPVVMTLISTDITATRWLNPAYFERHHAQRFAAGLVHYVMWVVVDPACDVRGANVALAQQALAAEARDGALLVFDVPETFQPRLDGGAAEFMLRMAQMVGEVQLVPLATQRYYALDFAAGRAVDAGADDRGDADVDTVQPAMRGAPPATDTGKRVRIV
jgi:hypothetical protein